MAAPRQDHTCGAQNVFCAACQHAFSLWFLKRHSGNSLVVSGQDMLLSLLRAWVQSLGTKIPQDTQHTIINK